MNLRKEFQKHTPTEKHFRDLNLGAEIQEKSYWPLLLGTFLLLPKQQPFCSWILAYPFLENGELHLNFR